MKGFKSFADATSLEFEPGVTAVVGPNGSGKSNVVDAVTWVLGSQSAKALRSVRMDDVIFQGTAKRPALGRAEVSLTLDNASGALPIDAAEVTITRTLFRNGDSEYKLNGAVVRLLDIQELLSDSGVGRNQHMIIGQGQLDSILQSNAETRRAVIEEAAGVLKHRRRKERAESRLAKAQENLERLGDLVREVRRQMRPLERQAASARSFADVEAELRSTRSALYRSRLDTFDQRRGELESVLANAGDTSRDMRTSIATLEAQASAIAAEMASRREEMLASALGRLQALAERARGTSNFIAERQRSLRAELAASADENVIANLEADVTKVGADLAALEAEESALSPLRDAVANAESLLTQRQNELRQADDALRGAQEAAVRSQARAEALARALEELSGAGSKEIIGGLDGVLGAFLDLIVIDAGWERAVEAAAGASVGAMVVNGRASVRAALEALRREGGAGLVLPVADADRESDTPPTGTTALRNVVRPRDGAPAHVARVLDTLFARTVVASDWETGMEVAAVNPELVVVTSEGDRFASTGWRVASGRAVVTRATVDEAERTQRDAAAALPPAHEARNRADNALDAQRKAVATATDELVRRGADLSARRTVLEQRRQEIESRLSGRGEERREAASRREGIEADLAALERLAGVVAQVSEDVAVSQAAYDATYREQLEASRASADKLEALRVDRQATEARLQALLDSVRSAEIEQAEMSVKVANLHEAIRRDLGVEPHALGTAPEIDLPEGVSLEQRVGELEARITSMGPINPLALEELAVLEERYRDLDAQVSDVRDARRQLQEAIRELDDQIMSTFMAAYADVNEHFANLIALLFPGGQGRLLLSVPDDPLNTGVEIEVRPMGRNPRRISLLSGGERSMAAIAFLFAIFRSRPSPFYMMDEVEAALDDVNLQRFIGLVDEFRNEAQLLIVTHQKRTMEAADALYGVTMVPGASSKVVSQRVKRDGTLVAVDTPA